MQAWVHINVFIWEILIASLNVRETKFSSIIVVTIFFKGVIDMMKVKLNVQTMYRGELLRAGKVYTVNKETAERWIASKLAEKVEETEEK